MTKKKVHLVLGSGGARGIAHIGVIELLEAEGYEIVSVTGCSMGAVVGGMYCAGFLDAYKNWLLTLNKTKVFRLFDFTFSKSGFVKGEKILSQLKILTGEQDIENLPIPYTAVATDILHKKEVHFQSGNLYNAMRASMGIPGVFTPVQEAGTYLVDGSVLNPLPLNLVNKKANELVVAVNLNGHCNTASDPAQTAAPINASNTWTWLRSLPLTPKKKNNDSGPVPRFSLFELLSTTYDFTQDRLTEMMIQNYPPDVLIEIPRNSCGVFEFYKAADLIALGKHAYLAAMMAFKKEEDQKVC